MQMTFRWYGANDAVTLANIKQIPGVTGIVSALYDVPVGEAWPLARLRQLKDEIENAGLQLSVIESIPVHEDIKLGRPSRDRFIDNYCRSIQNMMIRRGRSSACRVSSPAKKHCSECLIWSIIPPTA